jgi:hypothetical protein
MYVKNRLDDRKQKDFFNRNSPVSGLIINELSIDLENQDSLPVAKTSYKGVIQKFTQSTSKRIILKSFMGPVQHDMLSSNRLVKTDSFIIDLGGILSPESNLDPMVFEEDGNKIRIESLLDGSNLFVKREIDLTFPNDLEEDQKSDLIKKINSKAVKTYIFLKPETPTN